MRDCDRVAVEGTVHGEGVGVDQQLGRVGPQASATVPRPRHSVSVALARADAGHIAVPDTSITNPQGQLGLGAVVGEQAQEDRI
jgi:hypothetical protein